MHPKRRKKLTLYLAILIGLALAISLLGFALRSNLDHFFTPSQVDQGEAKVGQRLKIGGLVEVGSVERSKEQTQVTFRVTDTIASVLVSYQGILPDLFREGQGVVVQGVLTEGKRLSADKVLAKHDENYTPPEAAAALMKAQEQRAATAPVQDK